MTAQRQIAPMNDRDRFRFSYQCAGRTGLVLCHHDSGQHARVIPGFATSTAMLCEDMSMHLSFAGRDSEFAKEGVIAV